MSVSLERDEDEEGEMRRKGETIEIRRGGRRAVPESEGGCSLRGRSLGG